MKVTSGNKFPRFLLTVRKKKKLTVSLQQTKILTVSRKRHHPIDSLFRGSKPLFKFPLKSRFIHRVIKMNAELWKAREKRGVARGLDQDAYMTFFRPILTLQTAERILNSIQLKARSNSFITLYSIDWKKSKRTTLIFFSSLAAF